MGEVQQNRKPQKGQTGLIFTGWMTEICITKQNQEFNRLSIQSAVTAFFVSLYLILRSIFAMSANVDGANTRTCNRSTRDEIQYQSFLTTVKSPSFPEVGTHWRCKTLLVYHPQGTDLWSKCLYAPIIPLSVPGPGDGGFNWLVHKLIEVLICPYHPPICPGSGGWGFQLTSAEYKCRRATFYCSPTGIGLGRCESVKIYNSSINKILTTSCRCSWNLEKQFPRWIN